MIWNSSQWRCYEACRSGILFHRGKTLRFLTLTSCRCMEHSVLFCFDVLVKRIKDMTPQMFMNLGLISKERINHYYYGLSYIDSLRFDYLYVLTSEGVSGVLHILYFGDYIHEKWLKDTWKDITGGAYHLCVEKVNDTDSDIDRVVCHNVGQSKFHEFDYSSDWIYRGWRSDFDKLKFLCCNEDYWECWSDWLNSRSDFHGNFDVWLNLV